MTAVPTVRLAKYHGLGNDFLVMVVAYGSTAPDDAAHAALAIASCDRHRGIGADGLLVCTRAEPASSADLRMRLRNADGSLAEMSGNGIRCFVHAALDAGLIEPGVVSVETDGGLRVVKAGVPTDGVVHVEVAMGSAHLGAVEFPDAVRAIIGERRATTVDVGNPHIVVEAHPSTIDLAAFGPAVEAWYLGTELHGINVEVVGPSPDNGVLDMAVWERGVGITQACGTGAVASAAVAHSWGLVGARTVVRQPGGDAVVALDHGEATLVGPSQFVCTADFAVPTGVILHG
jgi:diaminopimelate epimerase